MKLKTLVIYEHATFWIDAEVIAYYCLSKDKRNGCVPPEIQALSAKSFQEMVNSHTLPSIYADFDLMDMAGEMEISVLSGLEGQISPAFSDRTDNPIIEEYTNDYIGYIIANKEPSYFSPAYSSPEELLDEFKSKLSDIDFPEDFDWWKHIVTIAGTILS